MNYLPLIGVSIFMICIGVVKAYGAFKGKKEESEPLDRSFALHLITGIPILIVSIYYALVKPQTLMWLVGTIIISGIVAYLVIRDKNVP